MGRLDEPILVEHLEENLEDDPYGTAMFSIRNILHRALAHSNAMNQEEFQQLLALDETLRQRSNE